MKNMDDIFYNFSFFLINNCTNFLFIDGIDRDLLLRRTLFNASMTWVVSRALDHEKASGWKWQII
jgi:hypothetical protein